MRRHPPTLSITFLVFSCVPAVLKLLAKDILRLTFIVGTLKRWTTDDKRIAASGCAKSTLGSSHSLIVAKFCKRCTKLCESYTVDQKNEECLASPHWCNLCNQRRLSTARSYRNGWIRFWRRELLNLAVHMSTCQLILFGLSSILPHDPRSSIHVRAHTWPRELVCG